jgi:subtilisin-like proprotein convertase family protein
MSASSLAACVAGDEGTEPEITNLDGDAPLSERDSLYDGWPTNDKLPDEGKADAVYPPRFTELSATQSPVKSQVKRGVCSIFSTVALMEHLYIKEGTIATPDFSEQFLQWSVKTEIGAFANTEGSNANYNLQAVNQKGIVMEGDWPYQGNPWDATNDPACTGDSRPTRCWTNGSPPDSALAAQRWRLPQGRWLSSRRENIKAHLVNNKEAVVVSGTFFYQAWNHRLSKLTTNNDYWRKGYVTYPNADDKTSSNLEPAGHSIVVVGWDDNLEVQSRDKDGNLLTDQSGAPIMEKGFWLFKNSWGTESFGVANDVGRGYGWLSMRYVEEYLTAYVSGVPELDLHEVCGNEADDDFDGKVDCSDSECSGDSQCGGGTTLYSNDDAQSIPDNKPAGIQSQIVVADGGTIEALKVTVDISHTYRGDLNVKLVKDGVEVALHSRSGGSSDNLQLTAPLTQFNGKEAAGTWTLVVSDHAGADVGTLNMWSLEINTGGGAGGGTDVYESTTDVSIPDNNPTGASSTIAVPDSGNIAALKVRVDVEHSYKGDLSIRLERVGQSGQAILLEASGESGAFTAQTFVVPTFVGSDSAGSWRLVLVDEANLDQGTLRGWSLEVSR